MKVCILLFFLSFEVFGQSWLEFPILEDYQILKKMNQYSEESLPTVKDEKIKKIEIRNVIKNEMFIWEFNDWGISIYEKSEDEIKTTLHFSKNKKDSVFVCKEEFVSQRKSLISEYLIIILNDSSIVYEESDHREVLFPKWKKKYASFRSFNQLVKSVNFIYSDTSIQSVVNDDIVIQGFDSLFFKNGKIQKIKGFRNKQYPNLYCTAGMYLEKGEPYLKTYFYVDDLLVKVDHKENDSFYSSTIEYDDNNYPLKVYEGEKCVYELKYTY